jgi:hypothetical protein
MITALITYLKHGVPMLKKLYETGNNTAINNAFDWRIFFFREKFAKLGGRVQLSFRIIRENARNHFIGQLEYKKVSLNSVHRL